MLLETQKHLFRNFGWVSGYRPGPLPGFSSRGGQKPKGGAKNRRGATFLKYSIGCM